MIEVINFQTSLGRNSTLFNAVPVRPTKSNTTSESSILNQSKSETLFEIAFS